METENKKVLLSLAAVLLLAALAFGAGMAYQSAMARYGQDAQGESVTLSGEEYAYYQKLSRLTEIMELIDEVYYQDYDEQTMLDGAAKGMAYSIGDAYADYYTPEEVLQQQQSNEGVYYGIGVQIIQGDNGYCMITRVFEDSPAMEVGLQAGDEIRAVDGEDLYGLDLTAVSDRVKGAEGTAAALTVGRGEELFEVSVERRDVVQNRVAYRMIGEIGYIEIASFYGDDVDGFRTALKELTGQGAKGLIIDVRNNTGGYLDDAVEIADMLLPEGIVVYSEDKNGNRTEYASDANCVDLPIAVLVNGYSASASEVLCGAIRDFEAGVLVGTQTFGKGIVQTQYSFKDGAALKLTTAYYFTPSGFCLHGEGLTPDYVIDNSDEAKANPYTLQDEDDAQLQKALEVLRGQIAQP